MGENKEYEMGVRDGQRGGFLDDLSMSFNVLAMGSAYEKGYNYGVDHRRDSSGERYHTWSNDGKNDAKSPSSGGSSWRSRNSSDSSKEAVNSGSSDSSSFSSDSSGGEYSGGGGGWGGGYYSGVRTNTKDGIGPLGKILVFGTAFLFAFGFFSYLYSEKRKIPTIPKSHRVEIRETPVYRHDPPVDLEKYCKDMQAEFRESAMRTIKHLEDPNFKPSTYQPSPEQIRFQKELISSFTEGFMRTKRAIDECDK